MCISEVIQVETKGTADKETAAMKKKRKKKKTKKNKKKKENPEKRGLLR